MEDSCELKELKELTVTIVHETPKPNVSVEDLCPVCSERIVPKGLKEIKTTTCGYRFHKACLLSWFGTCHAGGKCGTCPVCRAPLSPWIAPAAASAIVASSVHPEAIVAVRANINGGNGNGNDQDHGDEAVHAVHAYSLMANGMWHLNERWCGRWRGPPQHDPGPLPRIVHPDDLAGALFRARLSFVLRRRYHFGMVANRPLNGMDDQVQPPQPVQFPQRRKFTRTKCCVASIVFALIVVLAMVIPVSLSASRTNQNAKENNERADAINAHIDAFLMTTLAVFNTSAVLARSGIDRRDCRCVESLPLNNCTATSVGPCAVHNAECSSCTQVHHEHRIIKRVNCVGVQRRVCTIGFGSRRGYTTCGSSSRSGAQVRTTGLVCDYEREIADDSCHTCVNGACGGALPWSDRCLAVRNITVEVNGVAALPSHCTRSDGCRKVECSSTGYAESCDIDCARRTTCCEFTGQSCNQVMMDVFAHRYAVAESFADHAPSRIYFFDAECIADRAVPSPCLEMGRDPFAFMSTRLFDPSDPYRLLTAGDVTKAEQDDGSGSSYIVWLIIGSCLAFVLSPLLFCLVWLYCKQGCAEC